MRLFKVYRETKLSSGDSGDAIEEFWMNLDQIDSLKSGYSVASKYSDPEQVPKPWWEVKNREYNYRVTEAEYNRIKELCTIVE
jgi:hypothetical protein